MENRDRRLVRGITDRPTRMPRVGKLRMGERSKERKGAPIAYWHFEARDDGGITPDSAIAAFEATYPGGQPDEIEVMFPLDDESVVFPIYYERWTAGSKCICRGDGYKADSLDRETGELAQVDCDPKTCPYYAQKECKHVGRMFFLLPKVKGLGVWQLDTRGWNCFQNVLGMIDFLKGITQIQTGTPRFAMIPLRLSIRPHEALVDGKTKTVPVLQMSYPDHSFADVLAQLPSPASRRLEIPEAQAEALAVEPEPETATEPGRNSDMGTEAWNDAEEPRPWMAEVVRREVLRRVEWSAKHPAYGANSPKKPTEKAVDFLRSLAGQAMPDEYKRHSVYVYLFGVDSSSKMTAGQVSSLIWWIKNGDYTPNPFAAQEAEACVTARLKEAGQQELFGETGGEG